MYDNNNNNKSTILVSLKSHHPGFPTSKIHGFRVIYFKNVWCLFVCLFVLHQTQSGFSGCTLSSVSSFVDWSIQEKIYKQVSAIYQSVNLYARQSILLFPSAFLPQFRFLVETCACTICSFEVFFDYFFQFFFFFFCSLRFSKNKD